MLERSDRSGLARRLAVVAASLAAALAMTPAVPCAGAFTAAASEPPFDLRIDLPLRAAGLTRVDLSRPELIALAARFLYAGGRTHDLSDEDQRKARAIMSTVATRVLPAKSPDPDSWILFAATLVDLSDEQRAFFEASTTEYVRDPLRRIDEDAREAFRISLLHDLDSAGLAALPPGTPEQTAAYEQSLDVTERTASTLATALLQNASILTPEQIPDLELAAEAMRQFIVLDRISTAIPAASLDPVAAYATVVMREDDPAANRISGLAKNHVRALVETRRPLIDRLVAATRARYAHSHPVTAGLQAKTPISHLQIDQRASALARTARAERDLATNAIAVMRTLGEAAPPERRHQLLTIHDTHFQGFADIRPASIPDLLDALAVELEVELPPDALTSMLAFASVADTAEQQLVADYLDYFFNFRRTMTSSSAIKASAGELLSRRAAAWHRATAEGLAYILALLEDDAPEARELVATRLQESREQAGRLEEYSRNRSAPWIVRLR